MKKRVFKIALLFAFTFTLSSSCIKPVVVKESNMTVTSEKDKFGYWRWMGGPKDKNKDGNFGELGVESATNLPIGRSGAYTWKDNKGNFWIYGGFNYNTEFEKDYLNDFWKYNGKNWIWMGGSKEKNQIGNYGTLGEVSSSNFPGARAEGASWVDKDGNFYLFGGIGYSIDTNSNYLNDLWKFDGKNWVWIHGSYDPTYSHFGVQGVANISNWPSSRSSFSFIKDQNDNLWIYGGFGYNSICNVGNLSDLWKFDGELWTYVSGSKECDIKGNPGTFMGTPSPDIYPGSKYSAMIWFTNDEKLWIFGGVNGLQEDATEGQTTTTTISYYTMNDLWSYANSKWTWHKGETTVNKSERIIVGENLFIPSLNSYSQQGNIEEEKESYNPGARGDSLIWKDLKGDIWLFGGSGVGSGKIQGALDDLWKFRNGNWAFMGAGSPYSYDPEYLNLGENYNESGNPGNRFFQCSQGWVDDHGDFWFFGGEFFPNKLPYDTYNDIWKLEFIP